MSSLLPFIVAGAIVVFLATAFAFGVLLNWLETKMSLAPAFFMAVCAAITLATVASLAIRIL